MSDQDNSPADILADRLQFGAGFGEEDQDRVLQLLSALGRHLVHWNPDQVDLEISVKNRGGAEQKVTLEARLPGWPPLVATSGEPELDHALTDVRKDLIRQIEDQKAKRGQKGRPPRGGPS